MSEKKKCILSDSQLKELKELVVNKLAKMPSIVSKDANVNVSALARTDVRYLFNAFVKEKGSLNAAIQACVESVNDPNNFQDVSEIHSVVDIANQFKDKVIENQIAKNNKQQEVPVESKNIEPVVEVHNSDK